MNNKGADQTTKPGFIVTAPNYDDKQTILHRESAFFVFLQREYKFSNLLQNTPDHNFILDVHPSWKNIVIGAGFSGYFLYYTLDGDY